MLNDLLTQRKLPDLLAFADGSPVRTPQDWRLRREEIKAVLCREEYGQPPPPPMRLTAEILEEDERFCAGNATLTKLALTAELAGDASFTFPVYSAVPNKGRPCPAFVHINFRDAVPDTYMPSEEICDRGFAVFSFCYQDVTADDDDFSQGLAGALNTGNAKAINTRAPADPGKIAMWAWAAMRVMDYMQGLESIDKANIAVVGHSRLGKTALWAGGLDERFAFVISNDSGCSGAAISRGKVGESVARICDRPGYWFCENYWAYGNREFEMPFDQHFLLALAAPRGLYVASAETDLWADPVSEFLACCAVAEVYSLLGKPGLVTPDRLPEVGETLQEGGVGYHLRPGNHYFSRYDWNRYMEYMTRHRVT